MTLSRPSTDNGPLPLAPLELLYPSVNKEWMKRGHLGWVQEGKQEFSSCIGRAGLPEQRAQHMQRWRAW